MVRQDDVWALIRSICEEENLTTSVKGSLKVGAITGVSGFLGTLVGGPVGAVGGAVIGGIIGSSVASDVKPLWEVIQAMEESKKRELVQQVTTLVQGVNATDAVALLAIVNSNATMRGNVLEAITGTFEPNAAS